MINGKFEYEVPKLILSQERIQIRTSCKKNSQGEIYLGTKENCKIRGYVSSSHRRVVPEVSQFTGTAVKISYGIDVEGLLPGESFQGQLTFLTNVGEYPIPFFVTRDCWANEIFWKLKIFCADRLPPRCIPFLYPVKK